MITLFPFFYALMAWFNYRFIIYPLINEYLVDMISVSENDFDRGGTQW